MTPVALFLALTTVQSQPPVLSLGDRCALVSAILNAPAKQGIQVDSIASPCPVLTRPRRGDIDGGGTYWASSALKSAGRRTAPGVRLARAAHAMR
jgi:hypothetical protein